MGRSLYIPARKLESEVVILEYLEDDGCEGVYVIN